MIDVVIIEDDPMVSKITEKIINLKKDFQVVKKKISGEGAVEYIVRNKIPLIILDMYLPDTEGLDLLENLREIERENNHFTDTIFVTASNDKAHIDRAFRLGVVDYLIKPFEFERLTEGLNRFLNKTPVSSFIKKYSYTR